MKTNKWLWLLIAVFGWSFYACSDEEGIGYESSPDWATEGGYKVLKGINGELTKEAAWKLLKEEILINTTDFYLPYVSLNILPAKTDLKTAKGEIITSPNYNSWVFLIDDTPGGFLSDLKRWIFVKLDGSYITVIKACTIEGINDWESILMWDEQSRSRSMYPSIFGYFTGSMNIPQTSTNASNRHAVIISGGNNLYANNYRYWNNCSALYNVLTKKYGYPKENIKSLISDGYDAAADRIFFHPSYEAATSLESSPTDLDQDGIDDVTGAATLSNVRNIFSNLKNTLTPNDELFIFLTTHGDYDGRFFITLWGENLYADDFKNMLNGINCKNIQIVNTTCTSGGFNSIIESSNRVLAAACRGDESSYPYSTFEFDTFPYYWISGMLGQEIDDLSTPVNCDLNSDNKISFYEAFEYAKTNAETSYEHAQYSSNPVGLGTRVGWEDGIWFDTSLEGDSYFCNQEIYNIPNLPTGANVTWNVSLSERNPNSTSELAQSSFTSSGSTLTLSRTAPATYTIGATITYNGLQETISKTASCGTCSPYNGLIYWESNLLNGSNQFNYNTGRPEFELDVPQDFVITSYVDFAGNIMTPTIDYIMSPDITQDDCSGNTATLTFGFSGEGDMELYLLNGCNNYGELYPFTIPYIVFDPNSYSLLLDKNNSTLNIASQTTTYGLRNENPIRTIEIRTYDRQTLLTFNVEDEQTNVADIDISSLSPGTYVLKVTDDSVHYLKLVI